MIGEGTFGQIVYGKHKYTNLVVAVKVMDKITLRKSKNYQHILCLQQEQRIFKKLKHYRSINHYHHHPPSRMRLIYWIPFMMWNAFI
jgi:serine/threonine protein kinase